MSFGHLGASNVRMSCLTLLYGLWGENIYNSATSTVSSFLYNPRFQGACQMAGGLTEMVCGGGIAAGSCGFGFPAGALVAIHGSDQFCTGFRKLLDGRHYGSATSQTLQMAGMCRNTAEMCDGSLSIGGTTFGIAAIRSQTTVVTQFKVPPFTSVAKEAVTEGTNLASQARNNHILYGDATGGGIFTRLSTVNLFFQARGILIKLCTIFLI